MADVTLEGGSVRHLVTSVAHRLQSEPEARWIVAHAAGLAPRRLSAALDREASAATVDAVQRMTDRRVAGEPLQYILGEWSFRGLEVSVDGRALVPRPETEQVVEVALSELRRLESGADGPAVAGTLVAVDLGTGSGVIALSLAVEGPRGLDVWATDVSDDALELARTNVSSVALSHPAAGRVHVVAGSWFDALPGVLEGGLHLVVSNPPYVSAAEWSELDPEVRDHEPRTALVPGETGGEALEALIDGAPRWLAPGGSLVLELAPHQADVMAARAEATGYVGIAVGTDLTGRDRTLVARRPI
jgi:release factor glutamine methyltransferase